MASAVPTCPCPYDGPLPQDILAPRPGDISLKIGIVGAGLGGLSAAIALRQCGHDVEIFERSRLATEVGAAIHMGPNATRLLRHWGVDMTAMRPVKHTTIRNIDSFTCETIEKLQLPRWAEIFDGEYFLMLRTDLHRGLKTHAANLGAALHTASEVVGGDVAAGRVTLKSGQTRTFDVLVAADGIHSRLAQQFAGADITAIPTGRVVYRYLVPTSKLMANPLTRPLFDTNESAFFHTPDRRFVCYPCSSSEIMNFAMFAVDNDDEVVEGWEVDATQDQLHKAFEGHGKAVMETIRMGAGVKVWRLLSRSLFGPWTLGKSAVMGDAAHPFLPFMGQGGAQAMEDAAALGVLLAHVRSVTDVPERLKLYDKVRRTRGSVVQILSSTPVGHPSEESTRAIEAARKLLGEEAVPVLFPEQFEYLFRYDVLRHSAQQLPGVFEL